GHELGVGLRLADLLDVHEEFVVGEALKLSLQLLDAGPTLTDDDARPRGEDDDLHLVGRALDLDIGDTRVSELAADGLLQAQVLMQPVRVVLVLVPLRLPGLDNPEPKAVRMSLVSHGSVPDHEG